MDESSKSEVTNRLASVVGGAGDWRVAHVGGPGSMEAAGRHIDPTLDPHEMSPEAVGAVAMRGIFRLVAGTAFGYGLKENVRSVNDAVAEHVARGGREVVVVGFSRGAVGVLHWNDFVKANGGRVTSSIGGKRVDVPVTDLHITQVLLDPVPGPGRSRESTVPAFVNRVMLMQAQDEARPGFENMRVRIDPGVRDVQAAVLPGVHGDIGGSTESVMTRLVTDRAVRFINEESRTHVRAALLSPSELLIHYGNIQQNVSRYTKGNGPLGSKMFRREGVFTTDRTPERTNKTTDLRAFFGVPRHPMGGFFMNSVHKDLFMQMVPWAQPALAGMTPTPALLATRSPLAQMQTTLFARWMAAARSPYLGLPTAPAFHRPSGSFVFPPPTHVPFSPVWASALAASLREPPAEQRPGSSR
ncbi:DUF2235 domain-containing protein [Polyangium fumosum]